MVFSKDKEIKNKRILTKIWYIERMIVTCPCGDKKFKVDASLIPNEGRLLQCGSCSRKWHFTPEVEKIELNQDSKPNDTILFDENTDNNTADLDQINANEQKSFEETKKLKKKKKKLNINYFKLSIVFIISLISIVLIIDTFKYQLSVFIPGLEIIMENLYESLIDIKLFMIDLGKND